MMYWDGNMGVWGYILMGVSFVLFWAAIITAIILFARSMGAGRAAHPVRASLRICSRNGLPAVK